MATLVSRSIAISLSLITAVAFWLAASKWLSGESWKFAVLPATAIGVGFGMGGTASRRLAVIATCTAIGVFFVGDFLLFRARFERMLVQTKLPDTGPGAALVRQIDRLQGKFSQKDSPDSKQGIDVKTIPRSVLSADEAGSIEGRNVIDVLPPKSGESSIIVRVYVDHTIGTWGQIALGMTLSFFAALQAFKLVCRGGNSAPDLANQGDSSKIRLETGQDSR